MSSGIFAFERVHPLLLIPLVLVLWLVGVTMLLFWVSAINAPGLKSAAVEF